MKRQDEKQMRRLYLQWLESGQSKTAFAKAQGIVPTAFYYWIKKFQEQLASPAASSTGFSLVSVGETPLLPSSQPTARICYPSGVWVELYGKLDATLLKSLAG
jgi:transposase-like protein